MTTDQIRLGTKTVTRRFGWWFLKPGDFVRPVEKAMGLKKGEKIKPIRAPLRIVSVRREPLYKISYDDCKREGFPDFGPSAFITMLMQHYGCACDEIVNRIEFEYTEAAQ